VIHVYWQEENDDLSDISFSLCSLYNFWMINSQHTELWYSSGQKQGGTRTLPNVVIMRSVDLCSFWSYFGISMSSFAIYLFILAHFTPVCVNFQLCTNAHQFGLIYKPVPLAMFILINHDHTLSSNLTVTIIINKQIRVTN